MAEATRPRDDSKDEFGRPFTPIVALDGDRNFEVRPSPIHGHGTFSLRPFKAGEVIGHAATARHHSESPSQSDPAVDRTTLGRYVNHSQDPNTDVTEVRDGLLHLVARTDVEAGEELTCHYDQATKAQLDAYRKKNTRPEASHERQPAPRSGPVRPRQLRPAEAGGRQAE